jgi:hypothetical protein
MLQVGVELQRQIGIFLPATNESEKSHSNFPSATLPRHP